MISSVLSRQGSNTIRSHWWVSSSPSPFGDISVRQFSDMTSEEKQRAVERFRKQSVAMEDERGNESAICTVWCHSSMPIAGVYVDQPGGVVLITTDAALADLDRPIETEIVINYDLPISKVRPRFLPCVRYAEQDKMVRRFRAFFGSRKDSPDMVVVNFIVAGMIERFRKYEEMCDDAIEVMPLHVADIFSETPKF